MKTSHRHISNHTLVLVRWAAILGQASTLLITAFILEINLPVIAAFGGIGFSIIINLFAMHKHGRGSLTDKQAAFYLGYDIAQLAFLLYLTGGLQNPFSILIIAPVTVGASLLPLRFIAPLTTMALLSIAVLSQFFIPMAWPTDTYHMLPLFIIGQWVALGLSCLFIVLYVWRTAQDAKNMSEALHATQLALLRQQKITSLGAQAAATAHELGSPLSTIAIIAKELEQETGAQHPLADDIALLVSQSNRCRDILHEFSRGKNEAEEKVTPLDPASLLQLIAEPHQIENSAVKIHCRNLTNNHGKPPRLYKSPELSHGLGNLIQNAIQFAHKEVQLNSEWNKDNLSIYIQDDGKGFSSSILTKIGQPYVSTRKNSSKNMGLGVFIAKTLLESTGATLHFDNAPEGGGLITIDWPRKNIEASEK